MELSVSESIMSRIILSEFQKVPKSLIPSTLPVAHSIVPVALKDLNPPTPQKNTRPFQKKKPRVNWFPKQLRTFGSRDQAK